MTEHKHEHGRKSSREIVDARFFMENWGPEPGDSFLDLGAGEGYMALAALAAVGPTGTVHALDIDGEWLQEQAASEQLPDNFRIIAADATREIPLERHSVDYLLMSNILHGFVHNGELDHVMQQVNRVLKPGGKLVLVEFKKADTPAGPPMAIRLGSDEIRTLLCPFGYSFAQADKIGVYHYQTTLSRLPEVGHRC